MLKLHLKYAARLKPFLPFIVLTFLADLLVANFNLLTPLFSKLLFDYAYPLKDLILLNVVVIATIGLYFLEFLINVMSDYMVTYVQQTYSIRLTRDLFVKCQQLPLKFFAKRSRGDLINRFTQDIDVVTNQCLSLGGELIIQLYSLVSILVVSFLMNPKITLLALVSLPLYIIETRFFSAKEEALEEEEFKYDGDYLNALQEKLKNIQTIKAFGQENYETERLMKRRHLLNVVAIKQGLVSIIAVFANSLTVRMWSIFVSWYMGYLVINGELSIGEVIALLAYVAMIGAPIGELSRLYRETRIAMVSFRRVDEIFEQKTEYEHEGHKKDLVIDQGIISFENISFAYDQKQDLILKDLSLHLHSKAAVAIVGESGSGKSTLMAILLRFFDPTKGAIYIDGHNISEVKLKSLRDQIGLVQQNFSLFEGTLRENIAYGKMDATDADVFKACQQAQIEDWIQDLPDGLDTEVGPDGDGLSGGQKQRVAIARVLLKKPPIVILDEATSALDPESEFRITEVINDLIGKSNLFVIAHRLSTIKKVDTILMLDDGKIVESGTFHELLQKKGAFFRFYSLQFGGFEMFKKLLDVEYERLHRYGSAFNLVALRVVEYQELHDEYEEDLADDYMNEVSLLMKKILRKGDECARFYRDIILVLLPEINEAQVQGFHQRVNHILSHEKIKLDDDLFSLTVKYSVVHIESPVFRTVDDLIKSAVEGLDKLEGDENFVIKSYEMKDENGSNE